MSLKELSRKYHSFQVDLINFERNLMIFQGTYDLNDIHIEPVYMTGTMGIEVSCSSKESNELWLQNEEVFKEKFNLKLVKYESNSLKLSDKTKTNFKYEYTFVENKYYEEL